MMHLVILGIMATATAIPWIPEPKVNDSYWFELHEGFVQNSATNRNNISVVFYGDSIVRQWIQGSKGGSVWNSMYAPLGAADYGIAGDRTEHLLYRIADREVENLNPKVVVLMIGTNNGESTDDVARGIRAVVDLLLERLPSAKALLLGILPKYVERSFERVADINIKISKFHDGDRVHFLDMFDQFADAWGVVTAELYNADQLHLETPGYQKWADTMEFMFNKLMSQ